MLYSTCTASMFLFVIGAQQIHDDDDDDDDDVRMY